MEHGDPEVLALVALGEPGDERTRLHLEDCEVCRGEVSSLATVVATARSVGPDDALVAPPDAVWQGIRSELGLDDTLEPTSPGATAVRSDAPRSAVRSRRTGLASRTPWVAAGAAAGLALGMAGGAWLTADPGPAEAPVLAAATLEPLPGWDASGQAVVEEGPDGTRVLVLSVDTPAEDGAFREVWLIDRDVTRLVSLGVLEGDVGRFTVPAGIDLADFAVVDVSEEPLDGDPAHSGDSIIRGILGA